MRVKIELATIAIIMVGLLYVGFSYYSGPEYLLQQYLKCLTQRNYDSLYSILYEDETLQSFTKEQIISYYKKIYDENKCLVSAKQNSPFIYKNMKQDNQESNIAFCKVEYIYDEGTDQSNIFLVRQGRKWKVKIPFKHQLVKVYIPLGAKVYLDNNLMLGEEDGYKEKLVLPGEYEIKVTFDNPLYHDYVTYIEVPKTTEVFLPYDMLKVSIDTFRNSIVEIAGNRKKNTEGTISFDNILEGSYTVKIYDENGYIVPIEKEIQVSSKAKLFDLKTFSLSPKGEAKLDEFLKVFYRDYLAAIKSHDCKELSQYIEGDNKEAIIKEFKSWFIDQKDITDASLSASIEKTDINDKGELEVTILENAELTNKELDVYDKEIQKKYRLLLKWNLALDMSQKEWSLIDKSLTESLVAYKDSEGKWIEY